MRSWPLACVFCLMGCGAGGAAKAALHSDLKTLQAEIQDARQSGDLDEAEVRDIAVAVARRELRSTTGASAVEQVREFRRCLRPLEDEFARLAEGEDDAAAAATLALLEARGLKEEPLLDHYAASPDPAWRAVAARAALGPTHNRLRRLFLRDGDLRVRRAAVHAALARPVASDVTDLAETARLDPDPLIRSLAVQALGAVGSAQAVSELRDLWPRAELPTRQGIVSAWAHPKSFSAGGERQLLWVLETQTDLPVVVAAQQLALQSKTHSQHALAVMKRVIQNGSVDEQRLAIQLAPAQPELLAPIAALLTTEKTADEQLQVMAAARLASTKKFGARASKRLQALAQAKSESVRRQARAALIAMREPDVVPLLKQGLNSKSGQVRTQAAVGLFALGHPDSAAVALADEQRRVRTQVACAILARR